MTKSLPFIFRSRRSGVPPSPERLDPNTRSRSSLARGQPSTIPSTGSTTFIGRADSAFRKRSVAVSRGRRPQHGQAAPSTSRHPPPRSSACSTGIPARSSDARSRRTVRVVTSHSRANRSSETKPCCRSSATRTHVRFNMRETFSLRRSLDSGAGIISLSLCGRSCRAPHPSGPRASGNLLLSSSLRPLRRSHPKQRQGLIHGFDHRKRRPSP